MNQKPASNPSASLFSTRHRLGYAVLLVVVLALFVGFAQLYRSQIDRYQYHRPRYAAERAIDALHRGDKERARREVALLASERPIGATDGLISRQFSNLYEGPVLRNRIATYEELTAELLKAGMVAEADEIAWKSILEYHIASRPVEMLVSWNLLFHAKLAEGDWTSGYEAMKILTAHGLHRIDTPDRLRPQAYPYDPDLTTTQTRQIPSALLQSMKVYYEAGQPEEFSTVADNLDRQYIQAQTSSIRTNSLLRGRIRSLQHRALIQAGRREDARRLLATVWGRDPALMDPFWAAWPSSMPVMDMRDRDPTLLEYLWRDRPAGSRVTIGSFVDSFSVDARVQIEELRGLKRIETGYFSRDNDLMFLHDHILFYQNVGAETEVTLEYPVFRIYLAVSSSVVLGLHPVLMLRIDDQAPIPVYCDSTEPELIPLDVKLLPGAHRFQFVYLNDAGFDWQSRNIREDRNLSLYRMVLVHVQPRD